MSLIKNDNENDQQYFARVVRLKTESGLTWKEVSEYLNSAFNTSYTPDTWRKKAKNIPVEELLPSYEEFTEPDEDILHLEANKQYCKDIMRQANAALRRASREATLKEIAKEAVDKMSEFVPLNFDKDINLSKDSGEALLILSDWHYGSQYDGPFNAYNTDIARERITKLYQDTYAKCTYNCVHKIHVFNLGDMIAGNIHLPLRITSQQDVITQTIEVSELLAELLARLANTFEIEYYSCIDNHSRLDPNKKDALQLESLTRITDWYLRSRVPNIKYHENSYGIDIIDAEIGNFSVLGVHGDRDNQQAIIRRLSSYTKYHWDIICSAHLHHFSADEDNECIRISNGALMGTDDYAHKHRLNSAPSQTLIIIGEDKPIECLYKLDLD